MARFRRRTTLGMSSEQHADTKIHVIGPGTVLVANHIMRETEGGPRSTAGGDQTIQVGRGLGEECNVGDICKYINIFIQAGPRDNTDVNVGWIEWAFVRKKELDADPVNTNLGTLTLGTVCTNYFRQECIYTGNIPIGTTNANSQNITIKIPKQYQKLTLGDEWVLYLFARNVSSTETATDSMKVVTSFIYRNYH